jgi:hypothetical protein
MTGSCTGRGVIRGADTGADETAAGGVTAVRTLLRAPPQAPVKPTTIRAAPGSQVFEIITLLNFVPDATGLQRRLTSRDAWAGKPKAR